MAVETPMQSGAQSGADPRGGLTRKGSSRRFWILWVLAACTLLALSEVLWLWHSWPVRELLDTEPAAAGASR